MLILRLMLPTIFQASTLLIVALLAPQGAPVQMLFFGLAFLTLVMGGAICAHKILATTMIQSTNDALRARLDAARETLLVAIGVHLKTKYDIDAGESLYLDFSNPNMPGIMNISQSSYDRSILDVYTHCMRETAKKERLSMLDTYFLKKSMRSKLFWKIPSLSAHDMMASLRAS